MSRKLVFLLSATLCLTAFVGCGKKDRDASSRPAVVPKPAQPAAPTEAKPDDAPPPPPTAAAPAADAAPVTTAPPPPFKFDDNDALTMLVNQFKAERGRLPTTVQELVSAGYAVRLPSPPEGKRFVIVKNSDGSGKVQAQ